MLGDVVARSTMKARFIAFLPVVVLAGISEAADRGARPEMTPSAYRLGQITVVGYDPRTNQLISDLSDHSWNQLDLSLLAAVEVVGPPGSHARSRFVRVTVTKGGRIKSQERRGIGVLDEASGRYYIPVWISGPFCENVAIRASIEGQKDPSPVDT